MLARDICCWNHSGKTFQPEGAEGIGLKGTKLVQTCKQTAPLKPRKIQPSGKKSKRVLDFKTHSETTMEDE